MGAGPAFRLRVFDKDPIGRGAFSTVYGGLLDSNRCVAVKRLNFRDDGDYTREAAVLSRLKHDNIIGYYGLSENAQGTYDLVLELACGITLAGAIDHGNLEPKWKRSTIYQIASGVAYLHTQGVLHLDLKPTNILFRDYRLERALICDFGSAVQDAESRYAGGRKFRAPDSLYTQKSDVFSLALIACCIFVERNPENAEETSEIVYHLLRNFHHYSDNRTWRLALVTGVNKRAELRPTAQEFRDAFRGPRSGLYQAVSDAISSITSPNFYVPRP